MLELVVEVWVSVLVDVDSSLEKPFAPQMLTCSDAVLTPFLQTSLGRQKPDPHSTPSFVRHACFFAPGSTALGNASHVLARVVTQKSLPHGSAQYIVLEKLL